MDEPLRVLFCDDSGGALRGFQREVGAALGDDVEVRTASSVDGFRELVEQGEAFDVVVSDLNFEQVGGGPKDGLIILREARRHFSDSEILLLTAYAGSLDLEEGLELASHGLRPEHVFRKTDSEDPGAVWQLLRERLRGLLQARRAADTRIGELEHQAFYHRRQALADTIAQCSAGAVDDLAKAIRADPRQSFHALVGRSFALRSALQRLERAAQRGSSVLVVGETGTGKELAARALHAASPRHTGPFVKTDLAALSRELVAAELFGHEKGAFTGAAGSRQGLVGEANGGVLFLDEVGNLTPEIQVGLLRLLEDRSYRPLGAKADLTVDAQVVAATHTDLEKEVEEGRFRADLLERLCVVPIDLPPLRDRREDIPLLAVCFLADLRERMGVQGFAHIAPEALATLADHPWPRNVRQLRNALERLFAEFDEADPIRAEHLRSLLPEGPAGAPLPEKDLPQRVLDGEEGQTLAQIARQYGEDAVREVIIATYHQFEGPPHDADCARLFGDMKANAWRQFACKRRLNYRDLKGG